MSLSRFWWLSMAAATSSFPYSRLNLLQCCDWKLSQVEQAGGHVTRFSDASGNGFDLLPASAGNGPLVFKDSDGRSALSFSPGQPLQTDYGQGYTAYTIAVLYRVYGDAGNYQFPYFGSPTPEYQPRPFIFFNNNNLQGYFGGGYGEYGSCQGGYRLAIFVFNGANGYNRVYHTGYGLTAQNSPGSSAITGATLGNSGNLGLRAKLFWNRPFSDADILELVQQVSAVHNLPL